MIGAHASTDRSFQYEERIVAFVDVLGFSALVKRSVVDPAALTRLGRLIATNRQFESVVRQHGRTMESAFFSDSFVVSSPNPDHEAIYVIRVVGQLCQRLLLRGLPCRGAIATGACFHDGRFVVGPALVSAYELEKDAAVFPRIIFDDPSLAIWRAEITNSATSDLAPLVKRDEDGHHFLDLFDRWWLDAFIPWEEIEPLGEAVPTNQADLLLESRQLVDVWLAESATDLKVRMKYEWLAKQLAAHAP